MSTVTLTEAAAYEVKDMLKSNDMEGGYLKIKVNGGGCTGLTYGMSAEEQPGENDEVLEFYGLKVLVDKYDVPVLNGTTIDFKQSLMGGREAAQRIKQAYKRLSAQPIQKHA